MTSTVKRRIKEHALIVWESMVTASEAECIAWDDLLCSLFVHCGTRKQPSRAETSAVSKTFQRSASKEALWQSNVSSHAPSKRRT
jgi:hypothetical protein